MASYIFLSFVGHYIDSGHVLSDFCMVHLVRRMTRVMVFRNSSAFC